jgi:hypothetical protein
MGIRQYGQAEVFLNSSSDGVLSMSNNEVFGFWGLRLCSDEEDGEIIPLREDDVVSFYRLNGVERKVIIVPSFHRWWVPFGSTLTVLNDMPQLLLIFPIQVRRLVVYLLMFVLSIRFSSPMLAVWGAQGELVWVGSIVGNPPSRNRNLACLWSWRKNMMASLIDGSPTAISRDGIEVHGSPACQLPNAILMRFAWFPANISANEWLCFFQGIPPYRVTLDRTLTFRCD